MIVLIFFLNNSLSSLVYFQWADRRSKASSCLAAISLLIILYCLAGFKRNLWPGNWGMHTAPFFHLYYYQFLYNILWTAVAERWPLESFALFCFPCGRFNKTIDLRTESINKWDGSNKSVIIMFLLGGTKAVLISLSCIHIVFVSA